MKDLVIVGDQAYLPDEWERLERRRQKEREYRSRPEIRARRLEEHRRWRERNRERVRVYNREWMRRFRRGDDPRAVASLHDLRCSGPTRKTGCRCKKIPLYRAEQAA